ncbi:MAG: hypothetical protein ACHP9S_01230 [Terriglobales bacterium]
MNSEDHNDYEDRPDYQEEMLGELRGINAHLKSRDVSGLIWAVVVVFLIASWDGSWADRWTDKLWYSFKYDANFKNVTVGSGPADCDFLRAPVGGKGCSYKKGTDVFGAERRRQLADLANTPEEKRDIERMPNSVTVFWEKKSE